ncbi:MAG TPA: PKD domain-containing protein [Candidatus Eisenbacteria bacterium]|nr:PKD domain-containing protein [Candidatus Eisenbacteria bacterium]
MRNRAYLLVALLGLVTLAVAPGFAAAAQVSLSGSVAARAAAVSGPVISVTPLSHDFGIVNVGSMQTFSYMISNTGDADLNISGFAASAPFSAGNLGSSVVAPGGSTTFDVTYAPTAGVNSLGVVSVNSDDPHGPFSVNALGEGNMPPVLDPIGDKSADAFVNLSFTTTATDDNDQIEDTPTFSVAPALPPGATYDTNTGHFSWTPTPGDAGTYTLTFSASDGHASSSETITITVNANNHPPVAVAGGPYNGGAGLPIQFNGTGSSDPDGNNLTYAWDFGDGGTGSGATPTHAYTFPNNYLATLTVTDDGSPSLSDSDVASVSVLATIPANLATKLYGGAFRITGGGTQAMGMEINTRPVTDIDPASIRLSTTYAGAGTVSSIAPDAKTATIGDIDNDGVPDMDVAFTRGALQTLLGNVPNGTVVTLVMDARTTAATGAIPIQGSISVKIKSGGGHAVSSFASPNPFNPETAVNFTLKNAGPVTVRIYSLEGRLVKTLVNEYASAGSHEVRWNGTDNTGRSVPSGMYFVKTESGADKSVVKLSLLK